MAAKSQDRRSSLRPVGAFLVQNSMAGRKHSVFALLPALALLVALSPSCASLSSLETGRPTHNSKRGQGKANPSIEQDADYRTTVDRFTERFEIINNFKTDNILQVTLLHPKLMRKISARHKQLFQDEKDVLPGASDKFSFVMSLYSRDANTDDLSNKNYWNVQIFHRGQTYEPVLVEELKAKSRWTPFFPHINPWTREFLVVFDAPLVAMPQKAKMVKQDATILRVSAATGKIAVPYPY